MATDRVLLVEFDAEERERVSRWLEEARFEVMVCPGPTAPDYTCVGSRGERCALAEAADIVVLDLALASDLSMKGSPGWVVTLYYAGLGKRLVLFTGPDDAVRPYPDEEVAVLYRPCDRDELLDALERLRNT